MQDVGHNMLHLHVAQQLPSLKQWKFMHQWVISPTDDNDAELTISIWHFSKENIARLTQVKNEVFATYTSFTAYINGPKAQSGSKLCSWLMFS